MPHPDQPKRKRGRPRKEAVEQRAEGDSPLWAMVDQLTLIHDDLKALVKLAKETNEPYPPPGALKDGKMV